MNVFKCIKRGGVILFLLTLVLAEMVNASGSIKIEKTAGTPNCSITLTSGAVLNDPLKAYNDGALKFYKTSSVPAPNQAGVPLIPNRIDSVSTATPNYVSFYFIEHDVDVTIRCFDNKNFGYGSTAYNDGKSVSQTLHLGSVISPSNQYLKTFQTDYLADSPNAPTIASVAESSLRDGDTQNQYLTLVVSVGYDQGAIPNRRMISASSPQGTSYAVEVIYPDKTKETLYTNGTISLSTKTNPKVTAGNYSFTPTAYNWYDNKAGVAKSWDTLSGTGSSSGTVTWTLKKTINTIAIPFTGLNAIEGWDFANNKPEPTRDISTINGLISQINAQIKVQNAQAKVTVIGWFDETTQKHFGLTGITYDVNGSIDKIKTKYTGAASVDEILNLATVTGRCYQVSVDEDQVKFKLTGTK
ncbi:MAG: hypothetical protein FD145_927 [Candidatus Saganbacteria bacterium]|uniref:Uncharacterized protein n=1 Tax=Candidatus Saganbacteria bacterium TaxID=2575572 RepID=A0A833L125_UNCSA|nr:MAG: hypothetical protein FD145_927 [Candidatus Saganbacteria bacterium]